MVVSDIGDAWSPKIPPEIAAAINGAGGKPSVIAKGIASGNIMAKVPQLEPMEKPVIADSTKISGNSIHSDTEPSRTDARNSPVPKSRVSPPSAIDNHKMTANGKIFQAPFSMYSTISLMLTDCVIKVPILAMPNAMYMAIKTLSVPSPSTKTPFPVISNITGTITTREIRLVSTTVVPLPKVAVSSGPSPHGFLET